MGLRSAPPRYVGVEAFLNELLIPFLYRLAYADRYGIAAAQCKLWGEYSHGEEGLREYQDEILKLARANAGRNSPCPCGNGKKYKLCHPDEVEWVKRCRLSMPG